MDTWIVYHADAQKWHTAYQKRKHFLCITVENEIPKSINLFFGWFLTQLNHFQQYITSNETEIQDGKRQTGSSLENIREKTPA